MTEASPDFVPYHYQGQSLKVLWGVWRPDTTDCLPFGGKHLSQKLLIIVPRQNRERPNGSVVPQPWLRDAETFDRILPAYYGRPTKSGEIDTTLSVSLQVKKRKVEIKRWGRIQGKISHDTVGSERRWGSKRESGSQGAV